MIRVVLGERTPLVKSLSFLFARGTVFQDEPSPEVAAATDTYPVSAFNAAMAESKQLVERVRPALGGRSFGSPYAKLIARGELETAVIQRLWERYGWSFIFARFYMHSWGVAEFVVVAPAPVRQAFEESGVRVAHGVSRVLWMLNALSLFWSGARANLRGLFQAVRDFLVGCPAATQDPPHVFWLGLARTEFEEARDGWNVLDYVRERRLPTLAHGDRVFIHNPHAPETREVDDCAATIGRDVFRFPGCPRPGLATSLRRIGAQIATGARLKFAFALGQWWNIMLGSELAELPRAVSWFRAAKPAKIMRTHGSDTDPLWTLLRKAFGAETWLLFHSTNCVPMQFDGEKGMAQIPVYQLLLSDKLAVWGEEQRAWLKSIGYPDQRIVVVGPIVSAKTPPLAHARKPLGQPVRIALFDVAPQSAAQRARRGFVHSYYGAEMTQAFVDDIARAARNAFGPQGYKLLLKSKRKPSPIHDQRYWAHLQKLEQAGQIERFPEGIDVWSAVVTADAVVSMPFTSPSVLGVRYHVPSIFYDPLAKVRPRFYTDDHPQLVRGFNELSEWMKSLR